MSIGESIKKLREDHNLTQAELGKIAGVSDKAVSTWENNIADPRMGAIQRIADYFHIPKSTILGEDDNSSDESSSELDFNEERLLSFFRELNEEGRRALLSQAKTMTNEETHLFSTYRNLNRDGREKLVEYGDDLVASRRYEENDYIIVPVKKRA